MVTRYKNAAYWEGFQAVEQHRVCTYTLEKDRNDWARGFSAGIEEERISKIWYKSRTIIVGIGLLIIGVGVILYGVWGGGGNTYIGLGGGVTGSSILMTGLRLITNTNVTLTNGYAGSSGSTIITPH